MAGSRWHPERPFTNRPDKSGFHSEFGTYLEIGQTTEFFPLGFCKGRFLWILELNIHLFLPVSDLPNMLVVGGLGDRYKK